MLTRRTKVTLHRRFLPLPPITAKVSNVKDEPKVLPPSQAVLRLCRVPSKHSRLTVSRRRRVIHFAERTLKEGL